MKIKATIKTISVSSFGLMISTTNAFTNSSTGMPWETGMQKIYNSLTGPIIGWIAVP